MKKILAIQLLTLVFTTVLFAQKKYSFSEQIINNGYTTFGKVKENKFLKSNENEKTFILQEITSNDKFISFKKISAQTSGNFFQEKFQLLRNGIEIRGAEYILTYYNNEIDFIHGFYGSFLEESAQPNLSKKECISVAINYLYSQYNSSKENVPVEGFAKEITLTYYFNEKVKKYQLAYSVEIQAKNKIHSELVFVSANTGELLGAENKICSLNFTGSAQTFYNGNRSIVTDANSAAGPFRMQELRNNVLIRTRNNNNQYLEVSGSSEIWDNDNNWTMAEHDINRAAFDAHWGAETVYDYWLNVHNRNSINGNGLALESFINVDVGGNGFNAFWWSNRIYYGNGIGGNNPLTSLDICAHEFGHGIDQYTGDFKYEKESGALDEGFADIWGACVEAWATPNKQRWLMGEDVSGGPIRNMANPNAFGQPDTYLGTNWVSTINCTPTGGLGGNDYCGVHTNSGVLNFWFYLLSDGGNGTNDIINSYSVTGIGINDAARIAYKTKLLINTSLADYPLTREISIQAVREIFGAGSCQEIAVTNAWFAVGVGAAYVNSTLTINGPTLVCNTADYSIPNLPAGSTVIWSIPSGAGSVLQLAQNTPTTNQLRITNMRWYGVSTTLTATITLSCSSTPFTVTRIIGNDNDNSSTQYGSYNQEACTFYNVYHSGLSGTLNGSAIFLHQGCMTTVSLSNMNGRTVALGGGGQPLYWSYSPGGPLYLQLPYGSGGIPFTFDITGSGACYNKYLTFFAYSNNSRYVFSVSPNPVSDVLTITGTENDEATIAQNSKSLSTDVTITANITELNTNQLMLTRKMMSNNKTYQLNVSSLRKGYHVLQIIEGDQTQTIKFLKL